MIPSISPWIESYIVLSFTLLWTLSGGVKNIPCIISKGLSTFLFTYAMPGNDGVVIIIIEFEEDWHA